MPQALLYKILSNQLILANWFWNFRIEPILFLIQNFHYRLQGFLKTYIDKLNKSTEFLKTEEGEQFALDALKISTAWDAGEIVKTSIQTVWTTYRVVQSIKLVKNNIEIIKAFKAVKGTNENREVLVYEVSLNLYLETLFSSSQLHIAKIWWTENLLA